MDLTLLSLFSGGGLADVGMHRAGFRSVGAVEFDAEIASVYRMNHPETTLHVAPVEEVDYRPYAGVDACWFSPSCKNASIANQDAGEAPEDRTAAEAIVRCLEETLPKVAALENVVGYAKFDSFRLITDALKRLGYRIHVATVNSADYGTPQTRKRLILRAVRGGRVPPLKQSHCKTGLRDWGGKWLQRPWVGWYAALTELQYGRELLSGLPESRFADWQLARLGPEMLETCLVESRNAGQQRGRGRRDANEPCMTVTAADHPSHWPKAFLVDTSNSGVTEDGARGLNLRGCGSPAMTVRAGANHIHRAFLVDGTDASVFGAREPVSCVTACLHAKTALPRAFLVDDQRVGGEGSGPTVREVDEPSFTLGAGSGHRHVTRAWLDEGRVVSMTPAALARFMGLFGDTYRLSEKASLACKVLGNGVARQPAEATGRSLREVTG